jgi:hypothetical protein
VAWLPLPTPLPPPRPAPPRPAPPRPAPPRPAPPRPAPPRPGADGLPACGTAAGRSAAPSSCSPATSAAATPSAPAAPACATARSTTPTSAGSAPPGPAALLLRGPARPGPATLTLRTPPRGRGQCRALPCSCSPQARPLPPRRFTCAPPRTPPPRPRSPPAPRPRPPRPPPRPNPPAPAYCNPLAPPTPLGVLQPAEGSCPYGSICQEQQGYALCTPLQGSDTPCSINMQCASKKCLWRCMRNTACAKVGLCVCVWGGLLLPPAQAPRASRAAPRALLAALKGGPAPGWRPDGAARCALLLAGLRPGHDLHAAHPAQPAAPAARPQAPPPAWLLGGPLGQRQAPAVSGQLRKRPEARPGDEQIEGMTCAWLPTHSASPHLFAHKRPHGHPYPSPATRSILPAWRAGWWIATCMLHAR